MGLDNRDYARWSNDPWRPRATNSRGGGGFRDWDVWKQILAINIAVFLLQLFLTRAATEDDFRIQPWMEDTIDQILTSENLSSENLDEPAAGERAAGESVDGEPVDGESVDGASVVDDRPLSERMAEAEERAGQRRRELIREYGGAQRVSIVQEWFQLDTSKVLDGQLWRLVTAGFCHDRQSVFHLLFNMLFLYWFGRRLEYRYGAAEFTALYFTGLIASSLAYLAVDIATGDNIPAIGASGAVWAVVAVYALLYPYEQIYVYLLFPIEIRWLVLLYFILDLHPLLLSLSGEETYSGVAHAAHIGGAVFGFLYWYNDWRLMPLYQSARERLPRLFVRERSGGSVHVAPKRSRRPNQPPTDDRTPTSSLDAILKKITEQGRESLTDDELAVLEETSREIRRERDAR